MEKIVEIIKCSTEEIKKNKSKVRAQRNIWINKTNTHIVAQFTAASYQLSLKWCWCDMLYKCGSCWQSIQEVFGKEKIWFSGNWLMRARFRSQLLDSSLQSQQSSFSRWSQATSTHGQIPTRLFAELYII